MKRRVILSTTGSVLLITALSAFAQTGRVMRLGILGSGLLWDLDWFAREMRARGWDVGRNLLVESRLTMGDIQRYRPFAKELVDARVDVIFADGDVAAIAAFNATRSIPIVMHGTSPVEMGMVKSLARPGGNVTGMVYQVQDYVGKELDLLRAIQPKLNRMGIAFVDHVNFRGVFAAWTAAGDRTGVTMVKLPWPMSKADIETTLAAARSERVQVIEFSGNITLRSADWQHITAWAIKNKVLTSRGANLPGEAVLSFGSNGPHFMEQLLNQLDRVLRGAKPADMPIQQPTVFDLVVNRKIAKAMGLTVPRSVLLLATEVID